MLLIFDAYHRPDPFQLLPIYEESIASEAVRQSGHSDSYKRTLAEEQFFRFYRESFFRQKGCLLFVWEHENNPVSALRLEPYKDGYLLCGLETAPAYRGNGHAEMLIRAVIDYLREKGDFLLYSHIHRNNGKSIYLHKKCGFLQISDSAVFLDGSVSRMYYTMLLK